MIGLRTRHSFAQFLELQPPTVSVVLLSKYGVLDLSLPHDHLLSALLNNLQYVLVLAQESLGVSDTTPDV
ncbi:hypothetical protein ALO80_200022 [Pseudomonas caricapapayae]|uniref:Uncharacterized protein n=1 Tax=Pseudomonas caricapapayae TaxID=46678 RepID=A0A0N8QU22_9PSED|nr:hypothetical protein ALO80_200022 [Pseudomonas caricapapayae]RMM06936.1 hypothetical protein ALQ84_200243 [Pseudomonas caricapapayae]RMW00154.1 hypothetical protein ALP01_200407 [Pseudomonas caricapapayae]